MSLQDTATAGGGDVYFPPAGNHPARLVAILDLGYHLDTYKRDSTKRSFWRNRALFGFQLLIPESGVIFKEFTLAFTPKAELRRLLEKLRGKPFQEGDQIDVTKMLGLSYLVSVIHQESSNGKTYAKIDGIDRIPKGMPVPPPATLQPVTYVFGETPAWPAVAWLPTHWFQNGQMVAISDILAAAKKEPPAPTTTAKESAPVPAASTNGTAQTNGAQTSAPATPAAPTADDYPF
jgi:hypothetical protein